jgi:hypothetical protein
MSICNVEGAIRGKGQIDTRSNPRGDLCAQALGDFQRLDLHIEGARRGAVQGFLRYWVQPVYP